MDFTKAAALAMAWADIVCEGQARIVRKATIAKPYGWIFFYERAAFLESGDELEQLLGNPPIIVDATTHELRVTGTARSPEHYIQEYEKSFPPASLQRAPQAPHW